jgi:hypothetical protein
LREADADEMCQTVLEQLGAKLEHETTEIHSVGVYDDKSAVAGLRAAQMCNLIGERLDQREPQIRARAEIIVIKLRASTDYTQQDRRALAFELSTISDEWQEISKTSRKYSSKKELATLHAGVVADLAATVLLELNTNIIDSDLLDQIEKILSKAERRRKEANDKYGYAFHRFTNSMYWRKFYIVHHDKKALDHSWSNMEKSLDYFEQYAGTDRFIERTHMPRAYANAMGELLELLSDYYGKLLKEDIVKELALDEKDEIFENEVQYFDAVSSNPRCFGFDATPSWADPIEYRRKLEDILPPRSKIEKILERVQRMVNANGSGFDIARNHNADISIEFSHHFAAWMDEDEKILALQGINDFLKDALAQKDYTQCLKQWTKHVESSAWREQEDYYQLLRIGVTAMLEAPEKVLVECMGNRVERSSQFLRFVIVEMFRSKLEELGNEVIDRFYTSWANSRQKFSEFGSSALQVLLLHSPWNTLCVCSPAQGERSYKIFSGIDGRTLTALNYRFDNDGRDGFITSFDSNAPKRELRPLWQNNLSLICAAAKPIGDFISSTAEVTGSGLLSFSPMGYFRFFPLGLIPSGSGVNAEELGLRYPTLVNYAEAANEKPAMFSGNQNGTFVECAHFSEGADLWNSGNEYLAFSKAFKAEPRRLFNASREEFLDSLTFGAKIWHFYGHGGMSIDWKSPRVFTQTGPVSVEDIDALDGDLPFLTVFSCCNASSVKSTMTNKTLDEAVLAGGSSCCISSRWPVLDDVTLRFMEEFYSLLSGACLVEINIESVVLCAFEAAKTVRKQMVDSRAGGALVEWSSFMITV